MNRFLRTTLTLVAFLYSLAPARAEEGQLLTLRVVSYKIKHGRGMDGQVNLERIAAVLRALKPDLVALQEIDNMCTRSGSIDEAAALGKLLGMEHRFGSLAASRC